MMAVVNLDMLAVESARARFRPERITTLFVGESAPINGKVFFYYGNSGMHRYMKRAVEQSLGKRALDDDASPVSFLERFKAYGWYNAASIFQVSAPSKLNFGLP
jgi:hypothetical protein